MVPGKEIVWDNQQIIGDVVEGQCETAGIGGKDGYFVEFLEFVPEYSYFKNVLRLRYYQTWCGATKGAMMWFAPERGQIKVLWEVSGMPTGYGMTLQSTSATEAGV